MMGYFRQYDPEVLADDASAHEQFQASPAYADAFEEWLDSLHGEDDGD